MKPALMVLVLAAGFRVGGVQGQDVAQEGERVRVEHHVGDAEPVMVEGWLIRTYAGDSIVMATKVERDRLSFRTPAVDRFQVYRVDTRSTRYGIIGGLAVGLVAYPFTESECLDTRSGVCYGRATALYAAAGGFLFGAVLGGFVEVPTWKDVDPGSFRVPLVSPSLTFGDGVGFTVAVAVGF